MGTDYKKISEDVIGEPVEAAGLFEPAGAQYSASRGGGAASGLIQSLSKRSSRTQAAEDLPKWMIIAVTASQIHVFEAQEKIGHYEIASSALAVMDRGTTTATKHLGGAAASGLSLVGADGDRIEVEAPRLAGHGGDVISLLTA